MLCASYGCSDAVRTKREKLGLWQPTFNYTTLQQHSMSMLCEECDLFLKLRLASATQVFACTVGQKPSKAPFYVNDTAEVLSILGRLVNPPPASPRS